MFDAKSGAAFCRTAFVFLFKFFEFGVEPAAALRAINRRTFPKAERGAAFRTAIKEQKL